MSHQATYRSVVQNLVAALEKEHGDSLSGWGVDAALGSLADVYRQAKQLTKDEPAPTIFVTREPDGRHDASVANAGLSDISVVFVDKTIFDKDGPLISIGSDDGMVFSATVKMVQPSPTTFDIDKVLDVSKRNPYRNSMHVFTGMERAIDTFTRWMNDSRPGHHKLLKTAVEAINEHGLDAYSDYLADAVTDFKTGMLGRARKFDPDTSDATHEKQLADWMEVAYSPDKPEMAISVIVYEQGIDKVMDTFENEPVKGPSI
jgi:hypothetical protein